MNQIICDLQVNYNILVSTPEDRSELWQYKWKNSSLSSSVQYIQSYNNLVLISTVISCNPHCKYSVHISPLCSVQLPNRKWSRGHFSPRGPDLRSAYSRHTGYVPRLRKELQTSSCPSISAKCRMKSPEDLKWVKLWGSGAGPTSISYLCWWPGVEGKFSIEYCIQLSGSLGSCILCGYSFLHLAMRPSLLLPSCFWHSSDPSRVQSAVAPTCTPATKKQLWSGTTSLVQLKEKERPA